MIQLLLGCAEPELQGTLRYTSTESGASACDVSVALSGAAYTGECEGCDFAFVIDAEVTEGDAACGMVPVWSLVPVPPLDPLVLAHSLFFTQELEGGGEWEEYDVLHVGHGIGGELDWYPLAWRGSDDYDYYYQTFRATTFDRDDDTITWSVGEDLLRDSTPIDWCDVSSGIAADTPGDVTSAPLTSTLPCSGDAVDVWSVTLAEAQRLRVKVDTLDAAAPFDPMIWLESPLGCVEFAADDGVPCTEPPRDGTCPLLQVNNASAGTWEIVVGAHSLEVCDELATYALYVDARDATPTLVGDDRVRREVDRVRVEGTAELR